MDRRSNRTKVLLENALIKLMVEKGFDKISINDLTVEADINRGTFYLHYKDKYDLLEQKENEVLKQFVEIKNNLATKYSKDVILPSNKENLLPIFICVYSYIKENADFIKVILGANGDLNFQMKLKNFIENCLVENVTINNKIPNITLKYISTIASSTQLGIIEKWLKTGMKETPQELAEFVSNVIYKLYSGVIKEN